MAERRSFDMTQVSTADKILTIGTGLYFIDSFLPWNRLCVDLAILGNRCASANLWHGIGVLAGLVALLLLVWEILVAAGVSMSLPLPAWQVAAGGAGLILVLTILKILIDNDFLSFGAWIGLILSLVIAYGGYMKMQEGKVTGSPGGYMPPPPPPVG
jgi:hypothetical protein